MAKRTLLTALVLVLVLASSALGAAALAGKTYSANSPSWGIKTTRGVRYALPVGLMTFKVSSSGKTVTVHFASNRALIYCGTKETVHSQVTSPAKISSSGSFKATVYEKFKVGKGPAASTASITQLIDGRFSGHTVRGTIHTEAPPCSGYTNFSATAH